LGYLSQDIYYSFHLLDVITRSPTLQNVIRSVTSNAEQLSLTLLMLAIIIYIFTMITFFYIQDNMYDWGVNAYDSDIVGENNCLSMF
jgi:inositol 1,4,5-triphosphate receptor type 3